MLMPSYKCEQYYKMTHLFGKLELTQIWFNNLCFIDGELRISWHGNFTPVINGNQTCSVSKVSNGKNCLPEESLQELWKVSLVVRKFVQSLYIVRGGNGGCNTWVTTTFHTTFVFNSWKVKVSKFVVHPGSLTAQSNQGPVPDNSLRLRSCTLHFTMLYYSSCRNIQAQILLN